MKWEPDPDRCGHCGDTACPKCAVRLGHDLDAVPVANATERTAPTWEARALAAEAEVWELRDGLVHNLEREAEEKAEAVAAERARIAAAIRAVRAPDDLSREARAAWLACRFIAAHIAEAQP